MVPAFPLASRIQCVASAVAVEIGLVGVGRERVAGQTARPRVEPRAPGENAGGSHEIAQFKTRTPKLRVEASPPSEWFHQYSNIASLRPHILAN